MIRRLYSITVITVFLSVLFTSQYYFWKGAKEAVKTRTCQVGEFV